MAEIILIVGGVIFAIAIIVFIIKNKFEYLEFSLKRKQKEIDELIYEKDHLEKNLNDEINRLEREYYSLTHSNIVALPYMAEIIAEYDAVRYSAKERRYFTQSDWKQETLENVKKQLEQNKLAEYQLRYLLILYPELQAVLETDYEEIKETYKNVLRKKERYSYKSLQKFVDDFHDMQEHKGELEKQILALEKQKTVAKKYYKDLNKKFTSNLTAIPCMSKLIADIKTVELKELAIALDWGSDQKRLKKAQDIRILRKETKEELEKLKWAEYQLSYLLELYPTLEDVIETDYQEVNISFDEIKEHDPVRDYLSKEEWQQLSTTEKNQLALDRYVESHQKSKWQIGRDYELYIGYVYEKKGYQVEHFGSNKGIEDLGRDLICKKGNETLIVQCKYWSKEKQIHEKHIMQTFGTVTEYNIENNAKAKGVLVTNITLSDTARKFADILSIQVLENIGLDIFPRIKCNLGKDELGHQTKIYHLPMDLQYDKVKLLLPGEMMVKTVVEAEQAGFRRAYKWHGSGT